MKNKQHLYEPVFDFREQRPQMHITDPEHKALYEKAFFSEDDHCTTEYAMNTTTWD